MKLETHIHDTKLQNVVENRSVKIQRTIYKIHSVANTAKNRNYLTTPNETWHADLAY